MKRSTQVVLVLSGAILQGCSKRTGDWESQPELARPARVVTNDTYIEGRGYYHAPYFAFYPYPYNYFIPGRGYYHGGVFTAEPEQSRVKASVPGKLYNSTPRVDRGGFVRSRNWYSAGS